MTVNFPTSYDDQASLFGVLDDLVVVTLNGPITYNATSATFNETSVVDALGINTSLTFQGRGMGPITFTGVTNDITRGGTYVGHGKKTAYVVEIDGTGTPNTFKWSNDGGATWEETTVNCVTSGNPYTLEEGITVYWASTTGHTMGDKWAWNAGFEIVRITSHGATGVLNITRGFNGSTPLAHIDDEQATQDPIAYDIAILREALIAAQKYKGLVGLDAAKPGSPNPGNVYIATNTNIVYVCFDGGVWSRFNRFDHGLYANRTTDGHSIYHTEDRKISWHNDLTGDHLISPTTHNHSGATNMGNPVKKFSTGLDASKGTPSVTGQVYYAYDQNNLYFSPNGSTWTRYAVTPKGSIFYFEGSCPVGWTAVTELDLKFVKGADTDEWSGLDTGGATSHTHNMPDLVNHTHTIGSQVEASTEDGSHRHSFDAQFGSGGSTIPYYYSGYSDAFFNTWGGGAHTHGVSVDTPDTTDTGTVSATSDSASTLPAYYKLRACRKT